MFNPSSVWGWYQRRSKWIKWVLIVFVIVAIVIAAIWVAVSKGAIGESGGIDPVKVAKDGSEKFFWQRWNAARKRDAEAAKRIEHEEAVRDELKEEREDAAKKNEDAHRAIDAADSIDGVDDALNSRR